jgi:hypothetical protein
MLEEQTMVILQYIIALVMILIAVVIFKARPRSSFYETSGKAIFQDVYSSSQAQPTYEYSLSYGYPGFTVKFKTKSDKTTAEAEGKNLRFRTEIEQLCKLSGTMTSPSFDVTRAVCFISEEELNVMLKNFQQRFNKDRP